MLQTKEKKLTVVRQFDFTKFTISNLSKLDLTPNTKLVLIYLSTCYNPAHKDVFPKQSTIANSLGISEASVIRAIKELLKAGLILVVPGYRNRYVFTNKALSFEADKLQPTTLQNETEPPCNLQPTIHEQTIEHDKEQHVEVSKEEEKKEDVISIDDFNLLKEYAANKGIANSTAYAKAIIKNGGAEELLSKLKEHERISKAAARRIEETKCYIKQNTFETIEELPADVKAKMTALKLKLGMKL